MNQGIVNFWLKVKTIVDILMGLVYVSIGGLFIFPHFFKLYFAFDNSLRYGFASLSLLYGGWRIVRSFKKLYAQSNNDE